MAAEAVRVRVGVVVGHVPGAAVAGLGLVGGYAVARFSKRRPLGGVVLAGAGAVAAKGWKDAAGVPVAAGLTGLYVVAFGVSHPLAKKIGAWPSVFAVAGTVAAASYLLADRAGADARTDPEG